LATTVKDADQVRRLLAVAAVYDGMSREEAARIGGLDRQTLRDWVLRAKADPGNADWQRDLAVSYSKIAGVLRPQGDRAKVLDSLKQGRAIIVRLTALSANNATWKRDLAWFDGQIEVLGYIDRALGGDRRARSRPEGAARAAPGRRALTAHALDRDRRSRNVQVAHSKR
jgi:hypothetical protein